MSTSVAGSQVLQAAAARLSLVPEGDDVTVGNPATGTFVAVPAVGGIVLTALANGASLDEAAEAARIHAGVEVDVPDFLTVLEAAGILVYDTDGETGRHARWIAGVPQRAAKPLFGKAAWCFYALALVFTGIAFATRPALRPSFENYMFLPDPMIAILVLFLFTMAITVLHEGWHWLAARAEGVPARFRISYRGAFIVAETDLSLLLTLPRRRRYGPMLAGPAFDVSVLAIAVGLRWAYFDAGAPIGDTTARLLGALVLATLFNLVWQCAFFMRTDLYAILACALKCENLYRVSWLTLKSRLLPLRPPEAEELHAASTRDRSVASWFSLLYLVGMLGVFAFMLSIALPSAGGFVYWMIKNIASLSFHQAAFWESVSVAVLTAAELLAPIPLAIRERRLRRKGVLA